MRVCEEESENMWKRELECDDKIWEVFGKANVCNTTCLDREKGLVKNRKHLNVAQSRASV